MSDDEEGSNRLAKIFNINKDRCTYSLNFDFKPSWLTLNNVIDTIKCGVKLCCKVFRSSWTSYSLYNKNKMSVTGTVDKNNGLVQSI